MNGRQALDPPLPQKPTNAEIQTTELNAQQKRQRLLQTITATPLQIALVREEFSTHGTFP